MIIGCRPRAVVICRVGVLGERGCFVSRYGWCGGFDCGVLGGDGGLVHLDVEGCYGSVGVVRVR